MGIVAEPIQQRVGLDGIGKQAHPFLDTAIAGQHQRPLLVAFVDDVVQIIRLLIGHGNLYMQAKILISGVRVVYSVHGTSMTEHEIVDLEDGGFKLGLTKSAGKMVQDPQYQEFKMMGRLGCQMSAAILAAFACELVMKAISLTCKDEASRTHDLLDLYQDLPEDSRRRVAVDYEAIADVMEEGRHIFGRWRYFENNAGPEALRGMVDLGRTLRLAKAARVLLDEAMLVGLYGGAKMNAREKVRVEGPTEEYEQEVKLTIKAGESPRRKAEPLPDRWTTVKSTRSEIDKCKKRGQPSVLSWSATRDKRQFDLTVSAGDSQRAAEEGRGVPRLTRCTRRPARRTSQKTEPAWVRAASTFAGEPVRTARALRCEPASGNAGHGERSVARQSISDRIF